MQERTNNLERRMLIMESILQRLGPVDELLTRITKLEDNVYTTKNILTFYEACVYLGISKSHLYKLTGNQEVPHYKPRGKMIYFSREELDEWVKRNAVPALGDVINNNDNGVTDMQANNSCQPNTENDATER